MKSSARTIWKTPRGLFRDLKSQIQNLKFPVTLLDATATLIDFAKTNGQETDRLLSKATARMEKRLRLLQLRRAKTIRRNRTAAFWKVLSFLNGGADMKNRRACFDCGRCGFRFYFGEFLKTGIFAGHGKIKTLICPKCNAVLIGKPPEDEI